MDNELISGVRAFADAEASRAKEATEVARMHHDLAMRELEVAERQHRINAAVGVAMGILVLLLASFAMDRGHEEIAASLVSAALGFVGGLGLGGRRTRK